MRPSDIGLHPPRSSGGYWVVAGYAAAAYWITQRVLPGSGISTDLSFYLIQPLLWLGLGALAYTGWRRLALAPGLDRGFIVTALMIGVVHVGVLVFSGIIGGFFTVRTRFDWQVYLENTWYVGAAAIGIETARCYLFHAWARWSTGVAWTATTLLFFVLVTPYAQFTALGHDPADVVGRSLVPALAVSFVATWFAKEGGLGASLAYRLPILAYMWYSLELPDLHWSTALATGVAAAAIALNLAAPLHNGIAARRPAAETT